MLRRLKMLGAAAGAAVLLAAPAQAAPVIDFTTGSSGTGGIISWDGNHLMGSDIPIGIAAINGADQNNGDWAVSGLAFGTGGSGFGALNFNTAPASNFLAITGCIADLGIGGVDAGGQCVTPVTLLSGTFSGWNADGSNGLFGAAGQDTKEMLLVDAINFAPDLPWQFSGFAFASNPLTAGGPGSPVLFAVVRNVAAPEPATMMLLGTGLLAAFRARRRKKS